MICPICKNLNKESTIFIGDAYTTLMGSIPYYDEEGNYHDHNPNWHTENYSCSEGHAWRRRYKQECCNCDYGHGTEKIDTYRLKTLKDEEY